MHRRSGDVERVDFFFTANRWDGQPSNREPHKCDDLAWHRADDLPARVVPYIRAAIGHFVMARRYAEFGWSTTPDCDGVQVVDAAASLDRAATAP
jgi:hypothetical protein